MAEQNDDVSDLARANPIISGLLKLSKKETQKVCQELKHDNFLGGYLRNIPPNIHPRDLVNRILNNDTVSRNALFERLEQLQIIKEMLLKQAAAQAKASQEQVSGGAAASVEDTSANNAVQEQKKKVEKGTSFNRD